MLTDEQLLAAFNSKQIFLDALRVVEKLARADALEEAAKICNKRALKHRGGRTELSKYFEDEAECCEEAIRRSLAAGKEK